MNANPCGFLSCEGKGHQYTTVTTELGRARVRVCRECLDKVITLNIRDALVNHRFTPSKTAARVVIEHRGRDWARQVLRGCRKCRGMFDKVVLCTGPAK